MSADAVISDCDGVLVDSETIAHEVEMEALRSTGIAFETVPQGVCEPPSRSPRINRLTISR